MSTLKRIDYLPFLESCWQEHLQPRADNAPTVISTFAGCGGSSLGYSMAGFRELLAIEWDNNAVETFKLNFPDVPVYHGDIAKISVEQVLNMTGLRAGELDVFDGSPPCQGFSTAGKRIMDDPRNSLFKEYVRLLRGLQPKVFVMENVSGMVKGKMKIIFAEILRELKASGYRVSARLLNAMYFGVPQSRQRMIFIGVREDLGITPSHPKAEMQSITVRDAIGDHAFSDLPDQRLLSDRVLASLKYSKVGDNGGPKMQAALYKVSGKTGSGIGLVRPAWDKPCFTIPKQEIHDSGFIHPDSKRYFHQLELKRCQSFCDEFVFIGDRKMIISRIGNSVPPLFMRSIAQHIRAEILDRVAQTA